MTDFSNKHSYQAILNEVNILKRTNSILNNENKRLRVIIQKIQDEHRYEICEYFSISKSIRYTADNYYFDNVEDCYFALVEYFGSSEPLQIAKDYEECYKKIFDSDEDEDEDEDVDEDENNSQYISDEYDSQFNSDEELDGEKIIDSDSTDESIIIHRLDD